MFKIAIILYLLLLSSACSLKAQEAPYEDVDKAAVLFFERLTAGKYDEIIDDSAKSFQEKSPRHEIDDNLKKMNALGKPDIPVRMSMSYGNEEGKRVATPTYTVVFNQNRATVILKFIDDGGEWKLGAFEVRQRST
jgi:hypothetical protein